MTHTERIKIDQVSAYVDAHRQEMLDLWQRLVETESGNSDKAGCDAVCRILKEELERTQVETAVIEMEAKGNFLSGVWGNDNPGRPVLLCGHMDTVFAPGTLEKNPFRMEENKAYGPGVLDMKAGLVIAVFVIRALAHAGYCARPIRVAFPGDEENGHRQSTAPQELERVAQGCAAALNFETGYLSDGLVVGRKGSCRFSVEVKGVSAHSGNDPAKGRNAILEMAHKVIRLQALNDLEHGTSVNVGIIRGGTVVNAVPDQCMVDVDERFTKEERLRTLLEQAREITETTFVDGCCSTMTVSSSSAIMEDTPGVMALFAHIQSTAREIGYGQVSPLKVGGWSDASLIASVGVPVVCGLGAKGEFNHTTKEYALVDSLFSRTKLAAAAILTLEDEMLTPEV